MKLLRGIKNFLYKFDFFYTSQLFRYKSEPEYRTLFGGILSLLIIIGLIVTFYSKLIDTLEKVIITSDSNNINAADPGPYTISTFDEDKFMFGVQIWHHDLNTGKRFFDIFLTSLQLDTGQARDSSLYYSLEPCTLHHWEGFPEVQKDYERLKMNYWLCLPKNMTYNIQGKYASVFSQTLEVAVVKCNNATNQDRLCASQMQIEAFFIQQEQFFFTIYFINPLINPTSQEYLTHYLEDNNYIIFTKSLGSEGILFMEQYTINTDESILPFNQLRQEKGGIVTDFALKNPYQLQAKTEVYCFFSFFKSGISRVYERKFQKIDEILSYIGGLFGTIAILLFVVNIYNGSSFEIKIGSSLLHSKSEKEQNTLKSYNFLRFILHGFYKFIGLFGYTPDWTKYKQFDDCKQEMSKQLDVLYLLKRITFLEKAIAMLIDEHQLMGLHLQDDLTLQQAKRNRRNFKIKRKVNNLNRNENKLQKKNNEFGISDLELKIKPFAPKVLNSYSLQNLSDIIDRKETGSISSPFKQQNTKLDTFLTQNQPYISDDSSSTSSEQNDDRQLFLELHKLKEQAKRGQKVSKKIWSKFNIKIKKNLSSLRINQNLNSPDENQSQQPFNSLNVSSSFSFSPGRQPNHPTKRLIQQPNQTQKRKQNKRKQNQQQTFKQDKNQLFMFQTYQLQQNVNNQKVKVDEL